MQKTDFRQIKINDIVVNPQVRKSIDPADVEELSQSILAKGVLQPIAVNQVGKKLMLIYGERRYTAAKSIMAAYKERNTIPAIVYTDLSDAEVLQLQIIENLQRKDVHPMEEAKAYQDMSNNFKMDAKDIALKVGKNIRYITERLKLMDLIQEFQVAFLERRILLSDALRLAKLGTTAQKELYENNNGNGKGEMEFSDYEFKKLKCDLTEATFDIKDPNIIKKAGACTSCPHNSAFNTTLFPDEAEKATCMDMVCFAKKTDLVFEKNLHAAAEDPETILVFGYSPGPKEIEMAKAFPKVYKSNDYTEIEAPDEPDSESEYREGLEDGYYDDEKDMKDAMERDRKNYIEEFKEYQADLKKSIKAFVMSGREKGKTINVILRQEQKSSSSPSLCSGPALTKKDLEQKVKSNEVTIEDYEAEIKRMKTSEERKRELDMEKAWPKMHALLQENDKFLKNTDTLHDVEMITMIIVLVKQLGYAFDDEITELLKSQGCKVETDDEIVFFNWLWTNPKKLHPIFFNLTRLFFYDKVMSFGNPEKQNDKAALEEVIRLYAEEEHGAITQQINEDREKRDSKLVEAIEKINKKIASLEPEKKKPSAKKKK